MIARAFAYLFATPCLFNYIIMVLYGLSAIWWAAHKKPADACYWLSALAITATVTFGYKH